MLRSGPTLGYADPPLAINATGRRRMTRIYNIKKPSGMPRTNGRSHNHLQALEKLVDTALMRSFLVLERLGCPPTSAHKTEHEIVVFTSQFRDLSAGACIYRASLQAGTSARFRNALRLVKGILPLRLECAVFHAHICCGVFVLGFYPALRPA